MIPKKRVLVALKAQTPDQTARLLVHEPLLCYLPQISVNDEADHW